MRGRNVWRRAATTVVSASVVVAGVLSAAPAQANSRAAALQRVDVYTGDLTGAQFEVLQGAGVDHADVVLTRGARAGKARVEVTITGVQARDLAREGVKLRLKRVRGRTVAQRAAAAAGDGVPPLQRRGQHPRGAAPGRRGPPAHRGGRRHRPQRPGQADHRRAGQQERRARSRTAGARRSSTRPPSTRVNGSRPRWCAGCCTTTSTGTAATAS